MEAKSGHQSISGGKDMGGKASRVFCVLVLTALGFESVHAQDPIAQGVLKIAAPDQQKLDEVLKKNKPLEQNLLQYKKSVEAAVEDKNAPPKEIDRRIRAINQKYEPIFKKWFTQAQVNESEYQKGVGQYFKRLEDKTRRRYSIQYTGFLGYRWKRIPGKFQPISSDKNVVLSTPFDFEIEQQDIIGHARADRVEGVFDASGFITAAGHLKNIAGLGHVYELSDTYVHGQISVTFPQTAWSISALALVAGAAGASAKTWIEVVRSSDDRVLCSSEREHASAVAPVLWAAHEIEEAEDFTLSCEFTPPSDGDKMVMQYRSITDVWAGGSAASRASVHATPREIQLRLVK